MTISDIDDLREALRRKEQALQDAERRLADLQQRDSELFLRSAIDILGEGFALYDPDDRLVFFNERYREIYELSAPVIEPGRRFEDIVRYGVEHGQYPQAVGREEAWVQERVASHCSGNTDFILKIDGPRWVHIKEKRTPSGYIVGFRVDVTDIFRAKEAAEAASRAKSEFLANMSHEIRTPMNALLGLTQQVLEMPLEVTQRALLGKALNSGRALLNVLNNILDYSKIESDRLELEQIHYSIIEIVQEIGDLFSAQLTTKGLDFQLDIAPDTPAQVIGDPLRLHQVLTNLVGNAVKFTDQGEIRIRVAASDTTEPDKIRLAFAVSDTGIGFAPDSADMLFQPFTQADSSITRRYGGTGLGLAICQRLVAMMDGEISASGATGRGATFSFSIVVGRAGDIPPEDAMDCRPRWKKPALAGRTAGGPAPLADDARGQTRESPIATDPETLIQLLRSLRPYLIERELPPDAMLAQVNALARTSPQDMAFTRLAVQIDEFDHQGALATLARIASESGLPLDLPP